MADPAYTAPDEGLLARLRALKALTADPWMGAVVLLLEVFFAGIELAAVFAKLLSFVPATYATRLAQEDQLRQITTARAIAAVLDERAEPIADTVRPISPEASGTLTATGTPASGWPIEASLATVAVAYEPDDGTPDGLGADSTHGGQSAQPDRAALPCDTEMRTASDAPNDRPPRRRRGRPPKAR